MKKIILVLICLFVVKIASAQKELLAYNEQNKYIYYQVVDMPGTNPDTLHARALYFLKTSYPANKIEKAETSGNFTGSGKIMITSSLSVVNHIYGEVDYTYYIECKDGKYRYWLTDFIYEPHKTDRYGNSVPVQGQELPLENGTGKISKHDLTICLDETGTYCKKFGEKLKLAMNKVSALSPKEVKKKVVNTKDW